MVRQQPGFVRRFIAAWLAGYCSPARAAEVIAGLSAPFAGLLAVAIRGAANSLLWYLPQHLAGRAPQPAPYITLVPADRYYLFLTWFTPVNQLLIWLLGAALFWFVFRLARHNVDFGSILNISGVASLTSGAAIVCFDFVVRASGWDMPRNLWGGLHLVLDGWYYAVVVVGFRRNLGVPVWLGITGLLVVFAVGVPIAMLFMRA